MSTKPTTKHYQNLIAAIEFVDHCRTIEPMYQSLRWLSNVGYDTEIAYPEDVFKRLAVLHNVKQLDANERQMYVDIMDAALLSYGYNNNDDLDDPLLHRIIQDECLKAIDKYSKGVICTSIEAQRKVDDALLKSLKAIKVGVDNNTTYECGYPFETHGGICHAIMHNPTSLDSAIELMLLGGRALSRSIVTRFSTLAMHWPEHSKNPRYPVDHEDSTAQDAFWEFYNLWEGDCEYGAARIRLLEFVIDLLEKNAND